jgi:hypothetical protein
VDGQLHGLFKWRVPSGECLMASGEWL